MFQNYLKVTLRNLRKYKGYSFINILGLAVGTACCFLIMLYVRFELSYEDIHVNKNQIYRVIPRWMNNGVEMAQVWTPTGLAPDVAAQFSEIKAAARYTSWDGEALMQYDWRLKLRGINFQHITKPTLSPPTYEGKIPGRVALPIVVIKLGSRPCILLGSFGEKSVGLRINNWAVRLRMGLPNQ